MTTAHAEPSAGDHAHDDHADAFDGEPATTLPADEPRTPGWVPLLGLALFLGVGIALLLTGDDAAAANGGAAPVKTAEAAAPAVGQNARPAATDLPRQPDAQAGAAAAAKLSPEALRQIQMALGQAGAKGGVGANRAPAPQPQH